MRRICIALCSVVILLTACGRSAPAQTSAESGTVQSTEPAAQTQAEPAISETESEPVSDAADAASETQAAQTQSEPGETQTTTAAAVTVSAGTTAPSVTSAAYTLFSIPERTTAARTTTTTTTTTTTATKPTTTTTTTTKPTTTATTTKPTATAATASGSYHPPQVHPVEKTCTVTIDCTELKARPDKLKPNKAPFVPKNGYIVKDVTVKLSGGETVYDVLRKVCATHTCTDNCRYCQAEGIQMESTYTPQFDSYYVEGIHQLYEKDCGGTSGWTYYVNGYFPNVGSSAYAVKAGDRIEWVYSIEMDEREKF